VIAGLANVTAFALDGAGYCLAVRDLRTADLALNVEFAYKPIHDYFKVKFAHAAYYCLARFLIGKGTEGGVLIGKLCKRKAHLFLSGLGLGLYGHLYNGVRNLYGFKQTVGGVIPKEYIPAIKAGIEEASKTGSLGGFEVVDFKATLLDGSYHDVDSSEMAYKIAASMALKDALEKAGCVLLEPVMKVEVVMPDEYMGDVIGNLTSRRCRIEGTDSRGNAQVVDAICPLSEMFGYATDLRSRTQGRGTFTMQFDHYEQVSEAVAKKILGK